MIALHVLAVGPCMFESVLLGAIHLGASQTPPLPGLGCLAFGKGVVGGWHGAPVTAKVV